MNLFGVDEFTQGNQDSASFTSKIDKRGRALISAPVRKKLGLRFGSSIFVRIKKYAFNAKLDERGRFIVPAKIRKDSVLIEGQIRRCIA